MKKKKLEFYIWTEIKKKTLFHPGQHEISANLNILLPFRSQSQVQESGGNHSGAAPEYSWSAFCAGTGW